jgi:restriction endonuclease
MFFSARDAHHSQAGSPTPAQSATKPEGLTARLRAAKTGTPSSSKKSDGISAAQSSILKNILEAALSKLEVQELRINHLQEQAERGYAPEQRNWKEFGQAWTELNGKLNALHSQGIQLE